MSVIMFLFFVVRELILLLILCFEMHVWVGITFYVVFVSLTLNNSYDLLDREPFVK